ncbi:MAG: 23S rRNA (adenine(2503)-C(2))-methyltransferase RlmN [Desulfobacterales bacterium]
MKRNPLNILALTCDDLVDEFHQRYGKGKYQAAGLYKALYRHGNTELSKVEELASSPALVERLRRDLSFGLSPVVEQQHDDGLMKFATRLADGLEIESVIIPMGNRRTLCISCQVGCRMGCVFCETAKQGFHRNLTVEEIVGQVVQAKVIWGVPVRNIVFMGMGEPLDNLDNVIKAIEIISDQRGLDIARRHITVSTAAIPDGLDRLAQLHWTHLKIAISLNAPNDRIRSQLMPINRIYPMEMIRKTLLAFSPENRSAFFIEYVLIKDVNDAPGHADQLASFLEPLNVKVNIIPINPGSDASDTPFVRPSDADVARFCDRLVHHKVFVRKRPGKGMNLMAACGQLGNRGTGEEATR